LSGISRMLALPRARNDSGPHPVPIPATAPGDTFLLFDYFQFDFATDLPVIVAPAVCLDSTPVDILSNADPGELPDYVLLGYSSVGEILNCCLRKPGSVALPLGMTAAEALFRSVEALRLAAPFRIEIAGQFELEDGTARIGMHTRYQLRSAWWPDTTNNNQYSGTMIDFAARAGARTLEFENERRLNSARVLFAQVSIGMTSSLQMATMGLFAALEALFVPHRNKAVSLGTRVAHFLEPIQLPFDVASWLKDEYIHRRNNLMHGVQNILAWRSEPLDREKVVAFGRLHELVRLSLLGFLSLPDNSIRQHSVLSGPPLRRFLDNLGPARGAFVDGQPTWCE